MQFLHKAKESRNPVRLLIVTGEHDLISYVGIDHFSYEERFGEPGDIYYSIKLTQWKDTSPRRVIIDMQTKTAVISQPKRPGEPNLPENYTVQADDTLWLIAKRYYDDGNRHVDIYNANKAVIDPPNHKYGNPKYTIYPGQVLFVPPLSSLGNTGSYKENPSTGAASSSGGSSGSGGLVNKPDPFMSETQLWNSLVSGTLSDAQKIERLRNFYMLNRFSNKRILDALSATNTRNNIQIKIRMFIELLSGPTITKQDLEKFDWGKPTQEEADRLNIAFARYGITSYESIIQFMAIAYAESAGKTFEEIYVPPKDYTWNERGAGYIQVTWRSAHLAFLKSVGDHFEGADTASYIAKNYPLEVSVWYWSALNTDWNGVNEFIYTWSVGGGNTRDATISEVDPIAIFLKTAYYVGGMPSEGADPKYKYFNRDINSAIAKETDYKFIDESGNVVEDWEVVKKVKEPVDIIINGTKYWLPDRWSVRREKYEKARQIWRRNTAAIGGGAG